MPLIASMSFFLFPFTRKDMKVVTKIKSKNLRCIFSYLE